MTPHDIPRIRRILTALEVASGPEDLDAPTYRLYPLRGNLAGFWAVDVTANRRTIFRFEREDVTDFDLLDCH
ncbi:MAG: type II toxin-antitoxin system RelE/ParE family toxin [Chloroflexi bacterium]|nr:type II toxin-antitoxin system RelE/ParE family toxin [Chloroflexota bacterium]